MMGEFFVNNLYSVILFPLWIFLLIVIGRFLNVVQSRRVIVLMTLASTLYGFIFAIGCFFYMAKSPDYVFESTYSFLKIADYSLDFGVFLDNLSLVMLLLLTGISFVVQLYSANYMWKDKSFPRFFGYLNLFNFSMLGLVLSPNLFQNYVFWELVGVSSYLLIGFWYKKPSATSAAKKAFLMNRIGDMGLLASTIVVSYFMYQYSPSVSLATVPFDSINDIGTYLYSYTTDFLFVATCVLLLFGAIAKSAQFPLHTWLADAMEGPTPVSALIHSATMVAAGVYLIARLYPIFSISAHVMNLIAIIGLFTALICAFFAITQNDLKRILAYSTSSQLGLMFLAIGAGAYAGGMFHLVTHACFKSMLFLCSGIVIHSLLKQQDIRFMGGMRKHLPITAICYLVGCFSASGILFGGFSSKEMILTSLIKSNHYIFAVGFLLVALMTAFYMFRSYFVVFEGKFRGSCVPQKSNTIFDISIGILTIVTVFIGFASGNFEKFVEVGVSVFQTEKVFNPIYISMIFALSGMVLAYVFYNTKVKSVKIPVLYNLSYNRFYIDNLYDYFAQKIYFFVARCFAFFDKYIVDGVIIFAGFIVRGFSWALSKLQTGNFQSYLAYSAMFLAIAFTALMLVYTIILQYGLLSGGG